MSFLASLVSNRSRETREPIRFSGEFKSWEEAEAVSTGYGAPEILEKTRAALLKVKNGEAAFERDSVVFDAIQFDFSLLAGLLRAAAAERGRLSVLDFGGALGGTYFQHRRYLAALPSLEWSVVDQPAHVKCGRADFANEQLHFYDSIADCLSERRPNVLLLSGVLQYLREPYKFLENAIKYQIPCVLVDRTSFDRAGADRLMVEHVPAWIYKASYPVWFLSEPAFRKVFDPHYQLICEYIAEDEPLDGGKIIFKGFQFELKVSKRSNNGGD
jgi:putative methyltransferase (TIGR04325 family)